jgi:hypothetical protein
MRHASWLKPRRLHAFEGGDVATPTRPMNDDLHKARCKPAKSKGGGRSYCNTFQTI